MRLHPARAARCAAVAIVLVSIHAAPATDASAPATEDEGVVDAASLVRPSLLSGPGFSVDPHVELRGYMAHFTIDTRYGPLTADSVELLAEREAELPALDVLDTVTRSDAFVKAAGTGFVRTGKALGTIVMHPIDTVLAIPAGVARYFANKVKKIGSQARHLSDQAVDRLGTEGDPYPSSAGPMTDARAADPGDRRKKSTRHWYSPVSSEAEREIKRRLKFNEVKRDLAHRLGIDPYNRNPYVQDRLSSLAWVGTGGNFSATAALGTIGGVGAVVLSDTGQINDLVWKLSPADLRERNAERLRAYCRDEFLIRRFLRHGAFSPTLATALADALDALQPGAGGDDLLELGMTTHSELEARYLVNALRMTAAYLGPRAKHGRLRTIGAGLAYATADGALILPLPVDRLSWTKDVRAFMDRDEFRVANKTVLVAGGASLMTRRALVNHGWSLVVRSRWPHSPPYAAHDEPAPVDVDDAR